MGETPCEASNPSSNLRGEVCLGVVVAGVETLMVMVMVMAIAILLM